MEPGAAQIAAAAPPGAEGPAEPAAEQQAAVLMDHEPTPAAPAAAEAPAAPQPEGAAPQAAAADAAGPAAAAPQGEAPTAVQPPADSAEQLAGGGGEAKAEPAPAAPDQPAAAAAAADAAAPAATPAPAAAAVAAAQAAKPEPASVAGSRGTSPPAGGAPQSAATPADPAAVAAAAAAAAASSGGAPNSGGKGGRAGSKSDFQKEALEAAFAMSHYPTEEMKRVLASKIGLTPNQVNGWFTRRRRKEKDAELEARVRAELEAAGGAPAAPAPKPPSATKPPASSAAAALVAEAANEAAAGGGAAAPAAAPAAPAAAVGPSPAEVAAAAAAAAAAAGGGKAKEAQQAEEDAPLNEAEQQKLAEYEELIEAARAHFGEGYREDGPPLGFEFDDVPILPGAGGLSTGSSGPLGAGAGKKRKAAVAAPSPLSPGFQDNDSDDPDFVMGGAKRQRNKKDWESLQMAEEQRAAMLADKARLQQERLAAQIRKEQERLLRDKEKADQRVAKEREKELARLEAERRKHFERVQKEQKKLAAMQEKEKERLEKIRAREEKKKEKEMQRALQLQEKQAMRLRQREAAVTGPKDDLDIEWDGLIATYRAHNGLPRDIPLPADEDGEPPAGYPPLPRRPQFPPEHIAMVPALPPELSPEQGGALLTAWAFLHTFGPMLGTKAVTADELLATLAQGSSSSLLAELHCTLLRLIQADMEEAHATQYGPYATMPPEQRIDSRYFSAAHMLEEAWAWGYDIDSWRAHLNTLTWPEVARQLATVAGLGRRRPKPKKQEKPKLGQEGEDILADETGGLKLRLPSRLGVGTVKAAAWQVLAEAGPEGMHLEDICREIQKRGFRDLRTSKTPESSIGAALSKDVLFVRVKRATYALQAIIAHYNQLRRAAAAGVKQEGAAEGAAAEGAAAEGAAAEGGSAVKAEGEQVAVAGGEVGDAAGLRSPGGTKITVVKREDGAEEGQEQQAGEEEDEEEEEEKGEEEEEEEEEARRQQLGEPWLEALAHSDYDELPLEQRLAMLCSLCHLAMDSPSIRDTLEKRMEEQQRIKRQTFEEQRAEKRRRQVEAAAKAQAAAEEAQRALQRFQQQQQGEQAQQAAGEGGAAGGSEPGAPAGNGAAPMEVDAGAGGAAAGQAAAPAGDAAPTITPRQDEDEGAAISPAGQAAEGAAAASAPLDPAAAATAAAIAAAAAKEGEDRVAEAERARQRAEQARRDLEANSVRLEPLGMDRRYNRYWRLPGADLEAEQAQQAQQAEQQQQQQGEGAEGSGEGAAAAGEAAQAPATPALPPPGDRLLVESQEDGTLSVITTRAALAALMAALERKGARESGLYASLIRHRAQLEAGMPAGPLALPAAEDAAQQAQQAEQARRQALLDLHLAAPSLQPRELPGRASKKAKEAAAAEGAVEVAAAAELAPLREGDGLEVTRIKADLLRVQRALPAAALEEGFDGAAWTAAVREADSTAVLRRLLGELEVAVDANRLHPLFAVRPPLVRGAWLPSAHEVADAITLAELPDLPGAAAAGATGEGSPGGAAGGGAEGAAAEQQAGCEQQADGEQQEGEEQQQGEEEPEEEPLAWLPATLAAIALRLRSLDAALLYGDPPQAAARESLPGYQFIQRPTAGGVACGQPLGLQGRVKQTLFPPLPARLLYGPRAEFTFPKAQFEVDVASGSDALIATTAGRGGRGRGRGRGRGGRGGRGRGGRGTPAISAVAGDAAAALGLGVGKKKRRGKKGKAVGLVEKSALAKEFERSDSEKHYGSELEGEEEEEEGDEFASSLPPATTAVSMDATGDPAVSGPASTAGDDDEPLSGDEAISSDEN